MSGIRRCRLCSSVDSSNDFLNIFDENPESEMVQKIQKQLPFLLITREDVAQNLICHQCIRQINTYDHFYEITKKAEVLRAQNLSVPKHDRRNWHLVPTKRNSLRVNPKKRFDFLGDLDSDAESTSELVTEEVQENALSVEKAFIVNKISTETVIFTCPDCCQSFTKLSATTTHRCVRLEDCREVETVWSKEEEARKSVPPLKISLYSVKSGLFGCYMCQNAFQRKTDAIQHVRSHFYDPREAETVTKKKRNKGQRKGKSRLKKYENDDDWRKQKKKKKRKKEPSEGETSRNDRAEVLPQPTPGKLERSQNDKAEELPQSATPSKIETSRNDEAEELPQPETPWKMEKPRKLKRPSRPATKRKRKKRRKVEGLPRPPIQRKRGRSQKVEGLPRPPTHGMSLRPRIYKTEDLPQPWGPEEWGKLKEGNPDAESVKPNDEILPSVQNVEESSLSEAETLSINRYVAGERQLTSEGESSSVVEDVAEEKEPSGSGLHSQPPEAEPISEDDEVTIVAVVPKRTTMVFMSCVFCDKIFSSREALVYHQNRHLNGYPGLITKTTERKPFDVRPQGEEGSYLCRVCEMMFFSKRTLFQHELFHQVDCKPSIPASPQE